MVITTAETESIEKHQAKIHILYNYTSFNILLGNRLLKSIEKMTGIVELWGFWLLHLHRFHVYIYIYTMYNNYFTIITF